MSTMDIIRKLVVDEGAYTVKVGTSEVLEPTLRETPQPETFVNGVVSHYDSLDSLYDLIICNKLDISPPDYGIMVSEQPVGPKINRERRLEMMMERFQFAEFCTAKSSSLALFAHGRSTGLVVDSGYQKTHIVPVYHGYCLPLAILRADDIGGRQCTANLRDIIRLSGHQLDIETTRNIKEKLCYCRSEGDIEPALATVFKLPDNSKISLQDELHQATEIIFRAGLSKLTQESIYKCDVDLKTSLLFENIIPVGGNTMFPGFDSRLLDQNLASFGKPACVVESTGPRDTAVWRGAQMMAEMSSCEWVTRAEYEEFGASVAHRKCFF